MKGQRLEQRPSDRSQIQVIIQQACDLQHAYYQLSEQAVVKLVQNINDKAAVIHRAWTQAVRTLVKKYGREDTDEAGAVENRAKKLAGLLGQMFPTSDWFFALEPLTRVSRQVTASSDA